jgi:D-alanyl-D-alanine carboxypeptidase
MKFQYFIIFIIIIFSCTLLGDAREKDISQLYGSINARDYLTGRFEPARHELFASLSDLGIPVRVRPQYLRRDAALALKNLYAAFHRRYPRIRFLVRSSTRNFYSQKWIWEGKWSGVITVMGKRLDMTMPDPLKRALEILKYSSMPGASRHHWGTDFDLDVLNNGYYERGDGGLLYRWMVKNAPRYGYCQPYSSGREGGYCEERWHWSYYPLAVLFLAEWNALYKKNPASFSDEKLFHGSSVAGHLAPYYMNSISRGCE